MNLDGEVLNGRLVIYADSFVGGLVELVDALADIGDELVLVAVGKGTLTVLRELTTEIAKAALEYGEDPNPVS